MSDILDRIIAVKREEVRAAEQSAPLEELRLEASSRDIRDFVGALRAKHTAGLAAVIMFVFLLLTTLVFASIGILSASFAVVFKRGDPFGAIIGAGSALFSGVVEH